MAEIEESENGNLTLDRNQVFAMLTARGVASHKAGLYADAFAEYQEAQDNIRLNGSVVSHPRTAEAVPNPYLGIRDKAFSRLESLHKTGTKPPPGLWT